MEHNRNSLWFTSSAFAVIALVAITSQEGFDITEQEKAVKWAVSAISINIALSGLAILAILALKDKFVGTMMEGGMALLTTGFWAAVMPAINDPDNKLAASQGGGNITNANLYFFSWLALLMSFFILFDFMKHTFLDKGESLKQYSHVFSWAGLLATSFIVMANASRLFKDPFDEDLSCSDKEVQDLFDEFCKRTKFAVALGTISTIVALIWLLLMAFLMKSRFGKFIDLVLVLFNVVIWTCGIAYITFGGEEKAPANEMGNLYFFTWAGFALSVLMIMSSLKMMMDKGDQGEEAGQPQEKAAEQKEQEAGKHKEPESDHEMKGEDTKDVGEETV